jgi:hypothetical protein
MYEPPIGGSEVYTSIGALVVIEAPVSTFATTIYAVDTPSISLLVVISYLYPLISVGSLV